MNSSLPRDITRKEYDEYHQNGVVFLSNMFGEDWIELLNSGLTANCNNPTDRSRVWDRDAQGRTMFYDSQAWQRIDEYKKFVFGSHAAALAGAVMGSSTINFYFDAVFVRSPGSQFATPWHQDEPYWSVDGYDTCTIWMPLVPVKRENALAFVPGSHRSDCVYYQYNFGNLNPDGLENVDQVDFSGVDATAFPNIDENPEEYGVVSWDMQPGDCIAFNSRIMHGGSGKLDDDTELKVFTTKWLGDDVRIKFRDCGMDPDHSAIMTEYGLKPGDRPGTDLYPRIWNQ